MDLFQPELSPQIIATIPALGLAHIGDAVYEVLVRTMRITDGRTTAAHLHHDTTILVCAPAQAEAAERILPLLTPEELAIYRRGRNASVKNIPKNATHAQYSRATGLEALFGALYLTGQQKRILYLFTYIMEDTNAT